MHIEIETLDLLENTINAKNGKTYYSLEQPALLFKSDSKFPFHFRLRHAFTEDRNELKTISSLAVGKYGIKESAFKVNRFGDLELTVTSKELNPVSANISSMTKTA